MSTSSVSSHECLLEILFPDLDAILDTDWSLFSLTLTNYWHGEGNPEDLQTLSKEEKKSLISFCKQRQTPASDPTQDRRMLVPIVRTWLHNRGEEPTNPTWLHYGTMEHLLSRASTLSYRWSIFADVVSSIPSTKSLSRITREEDQEEIIEICLKAFRTKDWKPLEDHRMLQLVINEAPMTEEQTTATEKSWETPFMGDGLNALLEHIARWYCANEKEENKIYGNYFSIIQSSGMGKSRLIDEFSRTNVVIPMNLRESEASGYPPPDKELAKALAALKPQLNKRRLLALRTFLTALFECALATLDAIITETPNATYETVASLFRTQMQPVTFSEYGGGRVKFFEKVASAITEASKTPKIGTEDATSSTTNHSQSLKALVERLKSLPRTSASNKKAMPMVYLAFDESHTLTTKGEISNNNVSVYDSLEHVLSELRTGEICSIFLSTAGKISAHIPPARFHPSARVAQRTFYRIPPYTILGFDQVVHRNRPNRNWTIDHVSNISFMAKLGRPLFGTLLEHTSVSQVSSFAAHKLLGDKKSGKFDKNQRLACLSRRLPIEFYSTTSTLRVQEEQVQGHLRVCVRVSDHFENMVTTSPSEPLLSEMAARLLYPLSSHDVLSRIMYGFGVNRGDRGEFIALQLLLDARDHVVYKGKGIVKDVIPRVRKNESDLDCIEPHDFDSDDASPAIDWHLIDEDISLTFSVTDFLSELLNNFNVGNMKLYGRRKKSPYTAKHTFKDIFATARMNFNHVIKVQSFSAITPSTLPSFIARSSAALCANNQHAIDAVTFFTFESHGLLRTPGSSAILYQIKTSVQYTRKAYGDKLFDDIDPFELGILKEGDETPIIRIIFSFGAEPEIVPRTWKHGKLRPKFNTFDIWVGGMSSEIFGPVKKEEESAWKSILEAYSPNIKVYDATKPDGQRVSRSQYPLVGGEKEFHSFFDYETESTQKSHKSNASAPGPSRLKGKHKQGASDTLPNNYDQLLQTCFEGPLTPSPHSDDEDIDLSTPKHESRQPASRKRKQEDHVPENEMLSGPGIGLGITNFPTKRSRK